MNPIDWTTYYIKYQQQYRDFNEYSYYENHLNCVGIAKILLSIYMTELINQNDFTQYNVNDLNENLPLIGAYNTKIYWASKINNVLIATINRNIDISEIDEIPEIYRTVNLTIGLPVKKITTKTAIPFINQVFHETNSNCPICWQIDQLYTKVFAETNDILYQQILSNLDDNFLVNGYSILSVLEKNGYHIATGIYRQKFLKLKEYNSIYIGPDNQDERNLFLDKPRLIHSRWCKHCGSRKPDIYEEGRETDE